MALRINTNTTALTAHKNLSMNDSKLSSSIERLSSGLRINRAADDAAGLTISEKLKTQVNGINRAMMNVQDGISLIQTAEGALNEVQSMLQRMRELALQSSNDTLTTTDRLEIQKEIAQLKEDINRISYGTEFNTRKLLDGSGTAVTTTSDPTNLEGVVTGEVMTFSDFSVVVYPQAVNIPGVGQKVMSGTAQEQRSNILMKTDGTVASNSTTLQSISNFYDKLGNFILAQPEVLYVQGDNGQGSLTVSKDLTLDQLAERIQAAMTTDQLGNGLHFGASTCSFSSSGETNGQLNATSGKNGIIGKVNFTGDQSLITALGFQEVVAPEDPVYSIAVTNLGVAAGLRTTVTTQIAGSRASGLIQGIDLMFQPPTNASATTISAELGISIAAGFTFNVDDSVSSTNTVPITIISGTFSMSQVSSLINADLVAATSQVRCKINDSYALEFYTLNTGSAAYVSISNLSLTANPLGIASGRFTGTGGNHGEKESWGTLTDFDFSLTSTTTIFTISDRHSATTMTTITLTANYSTGGLDSLVEAINLQIGTNNLQVRAYNHNGTLLLQSTETGVESNFTITDAGGAQNVAVGLKLYEGDTTSGFDGNAADQNFAYDQSSAFYGVVIAENAVNTAVDNLNLQVMDLDGKSFNLTLSSGDVTAGASFKSLTDIANYFNTAASTNGVKVAAAIETAMQTIKFYSTIPGKSGVIAFTDLGSPDSTNTLRSVFDIAPQSYQNGEGEYAFTMHIKDASISFQIGPNQGHTAKANIIQTDIKALGIEDLDLTTVESSETAIGLIDKALQTISSERAKLGAIENRMTYTNNSLQVGLENMSAAESRIRDVDMAREVIEMTKFQILQQSSTAMLAQANTSAQTVLDLLR